MKEFMIRQFDKIVLLCLVVFFTAVALHIVHDSKDAAVINWGLTLVSGVLASLLTLITGAISKSSANPNNPVVTKEDSGSPGSAGNAGAKIAAAIADLPATGGVVDARRLKEDQQSPA